MSYEEEGPRPADVLRAPYGAFDAVVTTITDERSWLSTGCAGWAGAHEAGLHAYWLDRANTSADTAIGNGIRVIRSLVELPAALTG
ncbi:hypothetical protein [Streptomyces cellulosae]|uniref:Uncharacterized protein n=1 Tax=Streptomyces cellulosae TaxID=1968 RepID=A0ABW7XUN9_STRCE